MEYLKRLKKKHPELFEKEDSLGTMQYNDLKAKYPEYFAEEIQKVIISVPPKPTTEELLAEIIMVLKEKKSKKEF